MNAQVVSLRDDSAVKRRPSLWWRFAERHLPIIVIYLMVAALVGREIGNRMREVIAQYSAEDVYSTKRAEIQSKIRERAEAMLGEKMMVGGESEEEYSPYRVPLYAMLNLIDTLILGIELPNA